jgi:hypothetical protein
MGTTISSYRRTEELLLMPDRNIMTRRQTLALIDGLDDQVGASTVYFPAGDFVADPTKVICAVTGFTIPPEGMVDAVLSSKTGSVLFWGRQAKVLVVPPFPLKNDFVSPGYDPIPLRELLDKDRSIGLFLLRLGSYAIGVFQGETLVSSKVGTGLVHARHHKGGSSAQRFERHRKKQMEYFFERVCGHVRVQFEPVSSSLDYVVYSGERFSLLEFRRQCDFLARFDDRVLDTLTNVRTPRQATLESAIYTVWSSSVLDWGTRKEPT